MTSIFSISLDFELHWGCFESNQLVTEAERDYFLQTRMAIPKMLELFQYYDIHVTWATVGMLFHDSYDEWIAAKPEPIPNYIKKQVSSYNWIEQKGAVKNNEVFHFAPELIQQIINTPGQELATHTYSHFYCLEPGPNLEDFANDLKIAQNLAAAKGTHLKSLVFPRNQFNPHVLNICAQSGITSVRASPNIWYWKPATGSTIAKKFFRAADAYLKLQPIAPIYVNDLQIQIKDGRSKQIPYLLPATRLYRPFVKGKSLMNHFKLERILEEIKVAAKNGQYYHLWWHPHNLGISPRECLVEIEQILKQAKKMQRFYDMEFHTMEETANFLTNQLS